MLRIQMPSYHCSELSEPSCPRILLSLVVASRILRSSHESVKFGTKEDIGESEYRIQIPTLKNFIVRIDRSGRGLI